MRVLKGKVVTGVGNFSFWIEKLQDHYRKRPACSLLFDFNDMTFEAIEAPY
ncbi:MAG TPA: hypothetical protein VLL54_07020 [Pyrinomonadaceae bacterium]|nr:hypothetical protein [Pyrinomonadaceae bacterium]